MVAAQIAQQCKSAPLRVAQYLMGCYLAYEGKMHHGGTSALRFVSGPSVSVHASSGLDLRPDWDTAAFSAAKLTLHAVKPRKHHYDRLQPIRDVISPNSTQQ